MKKHATIQTQQLLVQFILLLVSHCLQAEVQKTRDDLPYHVQPTGYVLRLKPMPEDDMFVGFVKISILCVSNTSSIVLHADPELNVPLNEVKVREPRDSKNDIPNNIPILNMKRNAQTSQLTINLGSNLEEWATYEVRLHFSGKVTTPDQWGLFQTNYIDEATGEKKWYVGTKLKPGTARKVFPCFDGTEYKATFSIGVARSNSSNVTVLSNMQWKSVVQMKSGWLLENFHNTPRMLPSSIGLIVFELPEVASGNAPGLDIKIYGREEHFTEVENLLRDFMKLLAFLNDYLERTLPLDKIDIVVLPNFVLDHQTNSWGLIFVSDYLIQSDWSALHGLLDQWFRHFSTPLNHDTPLSAALHRFLFWQSGLTSWKPSDHLDGLLGDGSSPRIHTEHYEWFLRMLNYSMSAETLRLGLKNFMGDRQAFATYTDTVLWYFLTYSGHHDDTLDAMMTVQDIAHSWLGIDHAVAADEDVTVTESEDFSWSKADQDHILTESNTRMDRIPIVTVTRNYQNNTASVEQHVFLKQRLYSRVKVESFWWIPIMYLDPDNLDPSLTRPITWLKGESQVTIGGLPSKYHFIIVNPEYAGLFVVNYDEKNWRLLSEYLNSDNYYKIPELTRSKLLYDAWNLAYFGELDMVTALNMSNYLSREKSEVVWKPFLTLVNEFLEYVSDTIVEWRLERYILKQLLAAKSNGARWITEATLCKYGHEMCISNVREAYKLWKKEDDLDYKLTYDQFCCTFKYGSMDEYEAGLEYLTKFNIKDKWNYSNLFFLLQTLALCPVDTAKINRYFDLIFVEKNGNFTDSDILTIFIRFKHHAQGRWMAILDFVKNNFDSVKSRVAKTPHIWNFIIAEVTRHFITQEGLNEVVAFHKAKKGKFGSAEPFIQSSKFIVASEVWWSSKNLEVTANWLDRQIKV